MKNASSIWKMLQFSKWSILPLQSGASMIKKDYLKYENKKKTIKKRLSEITKLPQNHGKFCRAKRGKKKRL